MFTDNSVLTHTRISHSLSPNFGVANSTTNLAALSKAF